MVNKRSFILLALVLVIVIFPLTLYNGKDGHFGGVDDQGPAYITSTGFHPWFKSLWVPPNPEIESLLFATQAAIGAIIIGYILGYYNGMAKARRQDKEDKQIKKKGKQIK